MKKQSQHKPMPHSCLQRCAPYLLSGLLLGLSYPSYPYVRLEVLAWVWMAPMLLALKTVTSFPRFMRNAYLTLFCTSVIGMSWLSLSTILGTFLLFLLFPLILSAPFAIFYLFRRSFGWRTALWTLPFVWTACDWLYHQTDGSVGWVPLGVTQSNLYWVVQYADLTGVWGIGFWLVLFNVLLVMAVDGWRWRRESFENPRAARKFLARKLAAVGALMLAAPLVYSACVFLRSARAESEGGTEIDVLLVQPNVNAWDKLDDESKRAAAMAKAMALTNRYLARAQEAPDLIIWPETAIPFVLAEHADAREKIYRGVTRWRTPLLTGLLDRGVSGSSPGGGRAARLFNGAALFSPVPAEAGRRLNVATSSVYHKRVLMPFVERVPYVDQFPALQRLAINVGAGDGVSPGSEATVFTLRTRRDAEVRVAAGICYEYLYPAQVAELVAGGAQMLAFVTNEGWFSATHGGYQLAAFSRLRSIETRRAVARVGNTGITQIVDALGRVQTQAPWWSEQTLRAKVRASDELSLYVRYPDYFPKACAWALLALLLAAVVRRARASWRSFHVPLVEAGG